MVLIGGYPASSLKAEGNSWYNLGLSSASALAVVPAFSAPFSHWALAVHDGPFSWKEQSYAEPVEPSSVLYPY